MKDPIMHPIVQHNVVIHLGSVLADALNGVSLRGQTTRVCAELDKRLADAGSDKSKLISATLFITDMNQIAGNERSLDVTARGTGSAHPRDTCATIGVSDLRQDVLIEAVVTAAR